MPAHSTSSVSGFVTPRIVRLPVDRVVLAFFLDARARERDGRELGDVEEVGRLEVPVALLVAGIDARRVDLACERRLREVVRVEVRGALVPREAGPRTVAIIRCLTENPTWLWMGSIVYDMR